MVGEDGRRSADRGCALPFAGEVALGVTVRVSKVCARAGGDVGASEWVGAAVTLLFLRWWKCRFKKPGRFSCEEGEDNGMIGNR